MDADARRSEPLAEEAIERQSPSLAHAPAGVHTRNGSGLRNLTDAHCRYLELGVAPENFVASLDKIRPAGRLTN